MKAIKYLLILGAVMLLGAACSRESAPVKMPTVRFEVAAPEAVKALGDGALATKLFVRVYDAKGTFIREETPDPLPAGGWKAEFQLVEGTYSFSFWATSPDATAFQTNGSTLSVDYSKMHPGTDKEDAFWVAPASGSRSCSRVLSPSSTWISRSRVSASRRPPCRSRWIS